MQIRQSDVPLGKPSVSKSQSILSSWAFFWWWFPDLSTLDYFLRENLKDSVIANNLQIIDVLKNNIQNEFARNPREKLDTVITNVIVWAATIIQCQGASIEHNIIIELCSQTVGV